MYQELSWQRVRALSQWPGWDPGFVVYCREILSSMVHCANSQFPMKLFSTRELHSTAIFHVSNIRVYPSVCSFLFPGCVLLSDPSASPWHLFSSSTCASCTLLRLSGRSVLRGALLYSRGLLPCLAFFDCLCPDTRVTSRESLWHTFTSVRYQGMI